MRKIISILLMGIMCISLYACGKNDTSVSEEEKENIKAYTIGETVKTLEDRLEITLKSFEYVKNVYEGEYVSSSVKAFSKETPSEENCLIRVVYSIKNVGKEAENLGTHFGYIEFDEGYKFSGDTPMGIHLVACEGTTSTISASITLQPLSDEVEVIGFLEVPREIQEDEDKALVWKNWGVSYKIR